MEELRRTASGAEAGASPVGDRRSPRAREGDAGPRLRGAFDVVMASAAGRRLENHARAFVAALNDLGHDAQLVVDAPPATGVVPLVLAPARTLHGLAACGYREHAWLSRAVCVSIARPFTSELAHDLPLLAASGAPFAATAGGARLATVRDRRVRRLRFGYHETLTAWNGGGDARGGARAVDVGFFGHAGGERQRLLAELADVLDARTSDIRISRLGEPTFGDDGSSYARWLTTVELLLVAASGEGRAADWLDLVEAAANGAVALVVDAGDLDPFEPGAHVAVTTFGSAGKSLERALADRSGLAAMREHSRRLVESTCSTASAAQIIARARPPGWRTERGRQRRAEPSEGTPSTRHPAWLKPHAARTWPSEASSAYRETTPDVSVVIPVFNGADHVADAISSAAAARRVRTEVIVVDDASTDETVEIVRTLAPETPLLLVCRESNGGVAAARNDGVSLARAPLVFLLDADNTLLPHGLARLRAGLVADASAWFTYGIHVATVDGRPTGLLNTEPWSLELFRGGNYIDNAALLPVSTWEAIGGLDEGQDAWEDYDRWLRVASLGGHGTHVRSIVMRYAVRTGSLSARLGSEAQEALRADLHERYPDILGVT